MDWPVRSPIQIPRFHRNGLGRVDQPVRTEPPLKASRSGSRWNFHSLSKGDPVFDRTGVLDLDVARELVVERAATEST